MTAMVAVCGWCLTELSTSFADPINVGCVAKCFSIADWEEGDP